ncbi:MAG: SIS domain-containing protein [Euryarchaeota archaeon]|nr:SIS domain-containing protein [Euryarchaeota archaeon]
MTFTTKYYESIDIQLQFIKQLTYIPEDTIAEIIEEFKSFIFQDDEKMKIIYGIGEGRSALSLYDFLQQLLKFEHIFPVTLDDPIRRYFDSGRKNMIIAASGSGNTESVISYLNDANKLGAKEILITANPESTGYKTIQSHKGFIIMLEDTKLDKPSKLAVMGSEFELKLCTFLNCLLPALENNNIQSYYDEVNHFIKNAELLKNIGKDPDKKSNEDPGKDHLRSWIEKLFNRRGHIIVDGVGRSGFVARAFGMRLTHLGMHVYIKGDATTPSFVRGDVYIPITGSGDTREILDGMKKARKEGVDIFPITVSKNSGLVTYLKEIQHEDNIIYIPVQEKDREIFHDRTPSKINTTKMNEIRSSYSEINSYIFTNAVIASAIDILGVNEKYMIRIHW